MQIAVGGCLAQKDRGEITRRAPWVDVVFGTHNIGSLPVLLERARHNDEAQVEILESLEVFPSTLPTRRESPYAGWVSISVGCNNTCTFCIVPVAARHREGPPARRHPRRGAGAGRPRASSRSPCSGRTSTPTASSSATGGAFAQAAARLRRRRRAGAGALHQPAPEGLHRRRDRGDGRDPERHATAAHAAAVRLGRGAAARCAARYRRERYLGHHRPGAGGDARRGDHHRHHRRLPGRDRGRLRGHPRRRPRRRGSPAPSPSSTRSGPARRPRPWTARCPRRSCRSATSGWSRCRTRSPGPRTSALVGRRVEVLVAEGEGRKDAATAPDVRPRPRQPAGPLRARVRRATRRRGHGDGHLRRAAPPGRRRPGPRRPPDPGRRRLAGPPDAAARPTARTRCCSGLPAVGAPRRPEPGAVVDAASRSARARRCWSRRSPQGAAAETAALRAPATTRSRRLRGGRGPASLVVGAGPRTTAPPAARAAGTPRRVRGRRGARAALAGAVELPLSLTLGAWLLDRAGWTVAGGRRRRRQVGPPASRGRGARRRGRQPDGGWLVMGDGSARLSERAPGGFDPAAPAFDDAVVAALRIRRPGSAGRPRRGRRAAD